MIHVALILLGGLLWFAGFFVGWVFNDMFLGFALISGGLFCGVLARMVQAGYHQGEAIKALNHRPADPSTSVARKARAKEALSSR